MNNIMKTTFLDSINKCFDNIYNYFEDSKYCVVLFRKKKNANAFAKKKEVFEYIDKRCNSKVLPIRLVNNKKQTALAVEVLNQHTEANAILIRQSLFMDIAAKFSLNSVSLRDNGWVIQMTKQDFRKMQQKKVNSYKTQQKKKIVSESGSKIIGNSRSISDVFENWIMSNKENLLKNGTKSEKTVFQILRKILGSRVKTQQPFLIRGHCYYADICVKSKKIIIEVDGGYHLTPEQKEKDKQRDDDFKSIGYTTLRIYNSKSKDVEYIKNIAFTLKRKDFSPRMLRECYG